MTTALRRPLICVSANLMEGVLKGSWVRHHDASQFVVGVQWHAEWEPDTHALSSALYTAFVEAAPVRAARRE